MVFEAHVAEAIGDSLDAVFEPVCPVVHGVDAPVVAAVGVRGVDDAIHDRVAHVDVRVAHVDLRPQDAVAIGELAGLHALEEVEILLDGSAAEGAVFSRFDKRAAMGADLVGR